MAIMARCSWPPDTWCGIALAEPVRDSGRLQQAGTVDAAFAAAAAADIRPWARAPSTVCVDSRCAGLKEAAALCAT